MPNKLNGILSEVKSVAIRAAETLKCFDELSEEEKNLKIKYYESRFKKYPYHDNLNIRKQQIELFHHISKMKTKLK